MANALHQSPDTFVWTFDKPEVNPVFHLSKRALQKQLEPENLQPGDIGDRLSAWRRFVLSAELHTSPENLELILEESNSDGSFKDSPMPWHLDYTSRNRVSIFASAATASYAALSLAIPRDYSISTYLKRLASTAQRDQHTQRVYTLMEDLAQRERLWVEALRDRPEESHDILPEGGEIADITTRKLEPYEMARGRTSATPHRSSLPMVEIDTLDTPPHRIFARTLSR